MVYTVAEDYSPAISRLNIDVPAPNDGARRTNTVRWILDRGIFGPHGKRLVDLGAGPCVFARIARDHGYNVTAVDGRRERIPDDGLLSGIKFIQSDVRDFDPRGYDVVFLLGLLYHLEIGDQLSLLRRCAQGQKVLLDTQIHVPELIALQTDTRWEEKLIRRPPYEGVEFPEGDNPMAAIGNPSSFWHTEDSMVRMFSDAGFSKIIIVDPVFQSKYGARRFYLLES